MSKIPHSVKESRRKYWILVCMKFDGPKTLVLLDCVTWIRHSFLEEGENIHETSHMEFA